MFCVLTKWDVPNAYLQICLQCVLTKWVVSNAYLQMCLQMCSDQMICIKCVLTDVFTNLAHHRGLRTCFPKETKRRERSKTYFSSPQKSLLKRILAAIGALYVGIGMGLVMGMGWDEGGSLSHVETFLGCLSPVGLSSQLTVRGRGPLHLGWGLCLL